VSGGQWQFWIDRGGTFTDIIGRRPDGTLISTKLLSDNPDHYDDAAVAGMRRLMAVPDDAPFPKAEISGIRMGTTVATNALLERKGEPVVLLITRGFGDALEIGQQNRPHLFDLDIRRPAPLYAHVIEVDERCSADGEILIPLDEERLLADLQAARRSGLRAVAIVFVHGYRFTAHEKRAAELAREAGFAQISMSHDVAPLIKLVPRGHTTVADAGLNPVLRRYVSRLDAALGGVPLFFMRSSGGLAKADHFRGRDAILSGPAGGVVGAVETALAAGHDRVIAFDMGGTSTDVSHYAGAYERSFDAEIAGARLMVPQMLIHTVAAGGGSVCSFDGQRLRVGPQSAGADPGPLCYRKGGPLTITDCNVMRGVLAPDHFPAIFGPDQAQKLDRDGVVAAFEALAQQITAQQGAEMSGQAVAQGFITIAVEHMARAIKKITVERGHDISRYSLVAFGGAGGQHACLVADALGMKRVLLHPLSGVLSALGMGLADLRELREQAADLALDDDHEAAIARSLDQIEGEARAALADQLVPPDHPGADLGAEAILCTRQVHVKYRGSDSTLLVPFETVASARAAFEAAHRQNFGFIDEGRPMIVDAVSVEAVAKGEKSALALEACSGSHQPLEHRPITCRDENGRLALLEAPFYRRPDLAVDRPIAGPAVILDDTGTYVVEPGWQAVRTGRDDLLMERVAARRVRTGDEDRPDPVLLEVFNNLFMSVAENMGVVLARTAHSVNMKERLDFSCAVFDRNGNLIANAPHMPVHLGSMGESVKAVMAAFAGQFHPGDAVMMNDPFNGGTHLPDITVVTPAFMEGDEGGGTQREPQFYVASRGHHADIGGIAPGSMPAQSVDIREEGVLIPPCLIRHQGRFLEDDLRKRLGEGPWPARNPDQNIADLKAKLAANERGVAEVRRLVDLYGLAVVDRYMGHVQDNAEASVKAVIDRLEDGTARYAMDCGAVIEVALRVDRQARTAVIDFTGTSGRHGGNFNAPKAITRAAVLYVFRCLVGADIPLNDGCLKPLRLIIPEGCLLDPAFPAAVVAGNVETSQAITNALFLATGVLAASQGTMNNLTFGNARHQYYETICGGAGAGDGFAGASAVQTHMTNSRMTDVEILEQRLPVRIDSFSIREQKDSQSLWPGGAGALRSILFLEDMEMNLLSGHRTIAPPGLAGGQDGAVGRGRIIRADGRVERLGAVEKASLYAGDRLVIETPGGGGYGRA
jgi:5-oxoprolinase (ATP-hydrolysing)